MTRQALVMLALLAGAAACNSTHDDGPTVCTALYAFGLSVQVQDSLTGATLVDGVLVTAQEGTYLDSLQVLDGEHFVGAGERAGTYTIRVTSTGYLTWERTGVVVTKDECHVHGVSVTAKLQR